MNINKYRIIVVNPAMNFHMGHNYAWNKYLELAFIKEKINYSFIFKKDIKKSLLNEFANSHAILTNTMHSSPFFKIEKNPCEKFISQALQIKKELEKAELSITPYTLLFCHTADPSLILGMLYWCASFPPKEQPALLFHFHFSFLPLEEWAIQVFSLIKGQLCHVPRAHFCAFVPYIISFLKKNLQIEVSSLPLFFSSQPILTHFSQITFGFMGTGRIDQGIILLPHLIQKYIDRHGKNRFIIQLGIVQNKDPQKIKTCIKLEELSQKYPKQVQFILSDLKGKEYYSLMQQCSLMLMPYDPIIFHPARPSQILQEAIYMNIPALVCKNSSLAFTVMNVNNGSIVAENRDINTLCDALFNFEKTADKRLCLARSAGKIYREKNNIDQLICFLLGFCKPEKVRNSFSYADQLISSKRELPDPPHKSLLFSFHLSEALSIKFIHEYLILKYSRLFIYSYYIKNNLDIKSYKYFPLLHFIQFGWKEGRNPNPYFDTKYYINAYPDIAAKNINPLIHYIQFGWKEGRNPSREFNTSTYLSIHKDAIKTKINPLQHFFQTGIFEYL